MIQKNKGIEDITNLKSGFGSVWDRNPEESMRIAKTNKRIYKRQREETILADSKATLKRLEGLGVIIPNDVKEKIFEEEIKKRSA